MRGFVIALMLLAAPAHAQQAEPWQSPDGAVSVVLPEMWNIVPGQGESIILVTRSLGLGPVERVCAVEKDLVRDNPVLPRDHLNALTIAAVRMLIDDEPDGESTAPTSRDVQGITIASYETASMSGPIHERRFSRVFLLQQGPDLARYLFGCAVRTAQPGTDVQFAPTRAFLDSIAFSEGALPNTQSESTP